MEKTIKTPLDLTNSIRENQKKSKKDFVFSIDWLTINIRLSDPADIRIILEDVYKIKRERGTNIFENVVDYYNTRDEIVFTICSNPYSSIIKADFAQLQIYNKWLYIGNLEKLLYKIFFHSNFEYHVISRIDICCDFYNFTSWNERTGKYYTPLDFINDFAKGLIKKTNPSKFTLWGKTADYSNDYHCINIGDSQSVFSWKLYNKSKEMKETNSKQYIKKKWERDLINFEENKDVWRMEVSIKDINKVVIRDKDINLNVDLSNWLKNYPYYFLMFLSKKFVFKDEMGKFIDFIKLPENNSIAMELSTNLQGKFEYSPTIKEKTKIIMALINIIFKSDTQEQANEYIEKIQDYIQEEDYYYIFTSKGFTIELLHSYYASHFNDDKIKEMGILGLNEKKP